MALGDVANIQDIQGGEAATARAGLEGALIAQFELLSVADRARVCRVSPARAQRGPIRAGVQSIARTQQRQADDLPCCIKEGCRDRKEGSRGCR